MQNCVKIYNCYGNYVHLHYHYPFYMYFFYYFFTYSEDKRREWIILVMCEGKKN